MKIRFLKYFIVVITIFQQSYAVVNEYQYMDLHTAIALSNDIKVNEILSLKQINPKEINPVSGKSYLFDAAQNHLTILNKVFGAKFKAKRGISVLFGGLASLIGAFAILMTFSKDFNWKKSDYRIMVGIFACVTLLCSFVSYKTWNISDTDKKLTERSYKVLVNLLRFNNFEFDVETLNLLISQVPSLLERIELEKQK